MIDYVQEAGNLTHVDFHEDQLDNVADFVTSFTKIWFLTTNRMSYVFLTGEFACTILKALQEKTDTDLSQTQKCMQVGSIRPFPRTNPTAHLLANGTGLQWENVELPPALSDYRECVLLVNLDLLQVLDRGWK